MKHIFNTFHSIISSKRLFVILATVLMCCGEAWATDYIFGYLDSNGTKHYLALPSSPSSNGNLTDITEIKTEDDLARCLWHCSSDNDSYSASSLGSDRRYLFVEVNGTKYWMSHDGGSSDYVPYTKELESGYKGYVLNGNHVAALPAYVFSKSYYYLNYDGGWKLKGSTSNYATFGTSVFVYASPTNGGHVSVYGSTTSSPAYSSSFDYANRTTSSSYYLYYQTSLYRFKGWSDTNSYSDIDFSDNGHQITLDGTANCNVKYYAMFLPYWKFAAIGVAQPSDSYGTVTTDWSEKEVEATTGTQSSASVDVKFTATPESGYAFSGWTRTQGKMTPDNDASGNPMVANPYTETLTNNITGTTYTETLYAIFYELVDPTGMSVSPTSMELTKDATKQITVTMTPELCYKNLTFTSSNTAAATVDANGLVTGVKSGKSTITVTAKKQDGTTTIALTKTVTVKVMEKLPTPVMTVEGVEADNYNKALVTITAGSGSPAGTIIRYTTDGTEPKATSTEYTAPFKINNLQTVKARAYCTDWYESDVVSQMYSKRITSKPTINITLSSSEYLVSFTCTDDDVTYYYTTDGSTPTYNKSTGDPTGTTVKWNGTAFNPGVAECVITAIATHAEWQDSKAATKNYVRASGVSGGVVYLNDYEDHTWTYYAGVDSTVDEGNYNTNYKNIIYSPNPRNVKITYNGVDLSGSLSTNVAVSKDEAENVFVYYETLEQGSTIDQYPYQVISNPFSKRPKSGSTYYGFNGWKIKQGYQYIKRANGSMAADQAVLDLDEEITFVNLPKNVNGTSANVIFEATWTAATVKTGTSSQSFSDGTYETNFWVLTGNVSDISNYNSNATITMMTPDGGTTGDYRSSGNMTGAITVSSSFTGIVKVEWLSMKTTSNFNANGRNLTLGRGLTNSASTGTSSGTYIYGTNSGKTVNQTVKVESGTYTKFYHYATSVSSFIKQIVIFGSDYDRAKGDNSKLDFKGICKISSSTSIGLTHTDMMARTICKSGKIMSGISVGSAATDNVYYYAPDGSDNNYKGGCRYLEIQGGEWCCIAGGFDNFHDATDMAFTFRMRGGLIRGSLYGAGEFFGASGCRRYILTGGQIKGWLAAGANGTQSSGGECVGTSYVYVGGRAKIDSEGSTDVINRSVGGNVFGAGCGYSTSSSSGKMNNGTNVVIADECYVERGVYGGGSYGYTEETAKIYITGGHVGGKVGGYNGSKYSTDIPGGVFGGSCQNKGGAVNVYMTGGIIEGGLYGGNNSGSSSGAVKMVIAGGQIGTKTNLTAKACGGGYGSSTTVPSVDMTLGVTDAKDGAGNAISPYFYGNCYGGAALGSVTGNVSMTINTGGSYAGGSDAGGEIYCGGLGQSGNTSYGNVGGTLTTTINGTDTHPGDGEYAYNVVYGGAHYINQAKTPTVIVNGCDVSIKELYGGSKLATLSGTNITVNGGNRIGSVYGGSNAANINGNVTLKVLGGGIDRVFGGNNNSGTISGTINMQIDQQSSCEMNLGEVYGGGNKAASNSVAINIGCPGYIGALYGGANEANITGNIVLDVHGGTYGAIYGGNNKSGTISGSVTINASKNSTCALEIDTIFGGGNLADLAQSTNEVIVNVSGDETKVGNIYGGGNMASVYSTTVNVSGGQVSGNIFGGGKGTKGSTKNMILSGGTNVNITGGTLTNVFGGNDAGGTITGTLKTTIDKATALDITGEVYGGGNEASSAAGQLNINCADHIGSVYGGAKNADITGNIGLKIGSGTIDQVFGGNNLGGIVSGTITIDVQHAGCSVIKIGELYGAGNLADYTVPTGNAYGPIINLKTCGKSPVDWVNSGLHCLKVGTIFGAGKGASEGTYAGKGKVIGNPQINVNAGEIGTIYGGGNLADVEGNTYVNIIDLATSDNQDIYVTGNVYGGGNNAAVSGSSNVQIGPKK